MFELRELIAKLDADAEAGSPVDPQYAVSCAVSNVITVLVFNERLSQDPEFASVHEIMNQAVAKVDLNPIAILLQRFPSLPRLLTLPNSVQCIIETRVLHDFQLSQMQLFSVDPFRPVRRENDAEGLLGRSRVRQEVHRKASRDPRPREPS